ncbi:MAG: SGNH/GDSL hydrolase family protein [Micromonospora sp.]
MRPLPTVFRRGVSVLVAALTAVLLLPASASAASAPNSMASMGDSITRGFNACGWYTDCTYRSFSTGGSTLVDSHYLRILAKNPAISGHNYNDARSGAKASAMPGQASTAVSEKVQYVTILIGANDACTSSESTMTSVTTYRSYIDSALRTLKSGLPNARIAVISIPDIYRLWYIGHTNLTALSVWETYGICQSMLDRAWSTSSTDEARRQRVRQRVIAYNTQLAQACAAYGPKCDFDDNAVFNYRFALSQVSGWDYFHPSTSGQAALARVSYAAGFNW